MREKKRRRKMKMMTNWMEVMMRKMRVIAKMTRKKLKYYTMMIYSRQ